MNSREGRDYLFEVGLDELGGGDKGNKERHGGQFISAFDPRRNTRDVHREGEINNGDGGVKERGTD